MYLLGKNGFNYTDDYSKNMLIETINGSVIYFIISTIIILIYFSVKYFKLGIGKVLVLSMLTIISSILFAISLMAIVNMPASRIVFSIILGTYISSIIILTANFENNI